MGSLAASASLHQDKRIDAHVDINRDVEERFGAQPSISIRPEEFLSQTNCTRMSEAKRDSTSPSLYGQRWRSEWISLQDLADSRYEVASDPMFEDVSESARHSCRGHESIHLDQ
jgi:hypothetical protein